MRIRICPECGLKNPDDASYCRNPKCNFPLDRLRWKEYLIDEHLLNRETVTSQDRSVQTINSNRTVILAQEFNQFRMILGKLDSYSKSLEDELSYSNYNSAVLETSLAHLQEILKAVERELSSFPIILEERYFLQLDTIYYRLRSIEVDIKYRITKERAARQELLKKALEFIRDYVIPVLKGLKDLRTK